MISPTCLSRSLKVDSVVIFSSSTDKILKLRTYLERAKFYEEIDLDSMHYYSLMAYDLSLMINYPYGQAKSKLYLGISYWKGGDLMKGLDYCKKSLEIARVHDLKSIQAVAINNIGLIYNYQGSYSMALQAYQEALPIAESLKDLAIISDLLKDIGGIYYNLRDFKKAMEYWDSTYSIHMSLGNTNRAASALNNIGEAYGQMGLFNKALDIYFKALNLRTENETCSNIYLFNNIGQAFLMSGKLRESELYLTRALDGVQRCKFITLQIWILTGLAELNRIQNNFDKAVDYLNQAAKIGMDKGLNREASIVTKSLSDLYLQIGDFQKALEVFKIYHTLWDSLYNDENSRAISRLEARYKFEQLKNELVATQKLKTIKYKWTKNILFSSSILMFLLAALFYRNFQRKKKSNTELKLLNEEIRDQQDELMTQANQLKELNKKLHALNSNLEIKVKQRTYQLMDKNRELTINNAKLAKYAFINAHHLRAPVARILGLVGLFENKTVGSEERIEIIKMIKACTKELNEIVKEIQLMVDEGSIGHF